jgi:hypothetical protein
MCCVYVEIIELRVVLYFVRVRVSKEWGERWDPNCDGGGIGCSSTGLCLLNNQNKEIFF